MTDGKQYEDRSAGTNPESPESPDIEPDRSMEKPEENRDIGKDQEVPYMELFYSQETAAATSVKDAQELTAGTAEAAAEPEPAPGDPGIGVAAGAVEELAGPPAGTREDGYAEDDPAAEMDENELNLMIEDLCKSKAQEFRMLGYEHVTGQEVWECVSDKYQKQGVPPLHRIVNDILSLKVTSFMNWMTMSIYKDSRFR